MNPELDSKVTYHKNQMYYRVWLGELFIDCSFDLMVLYILSSSDRFIQYYNTASTFRKLENNL